MKNLTTNEVRFMHSYLSKLDYSDFLAVFSGHLRARGNNELSSSILKIALEEKIKE